MNALGLLLWAAAASPAIPATWLLTPAGLGPVKIGMTEAQVERALHTRLTGEPIETADACIEMTPAGPDQGVYFMFEERKLTRISIAAPSKLKTGARIGLGASAAEVRRAYPRNLKVEKHYYDAPPAQYLTYWTVPGKRGIRFETNTKRRVQTIHAGTEAIEYVEGCA